MIVMMMMKMMMVFLVRIGIQLLVFPRIETRKATHSSFLLSHAQTHSINQSVKASSSNPILNKTKLKLKRLYGWKEERKDEFA